MKELLFATGNLNKLKEAESILQISIKLKLPSKELLISTPPETGKTFAENALIKAQHIFKNTQQACFAEDSGLCVNALNHAPGIYSARYAGENANDLQNNQLLLKNLNSISDRSAFFIAVICFLDSSGAYYFEGKVEGEIAHTIQGEGGFGYDPLFIPNGYEDTFAILGKTIKNEISHRKRALEGLREFLEKKPPAF